MARMNYYSNNNVANNSNNVNPSATNLNVNQNKMLELEKRRVHTVFNVLIPTIAAVAITELSIKVSAPLLFVAGAVILVKLCTRAKKKNDALAQEQQKIKRMS